MNYRHLFHAGNFADVFKHVLLVQLLRALQRKDKGFAYLETHAGPGRYDLYAPAPQKSGEYRDGIARAWDDASGNEGVDDYLTAVRADNPDGKLRYYPGSPRIARHFLRAQDRMYLAELLPEACAELKALFARDKQAQVQCVDGYAALKAWLPPPERRGLVLIDPPYEHPEEWERLRRALIFSVGRWPQGTYAIWYPLKVGTPLARFKSDVIAEDMRNILCAELAVWPRDTPFRLNGCGMLIYNPPWQLDTQLPALLEPLANRLGRGSGGQVHVEWLVPE